METTSSLYGEMEAVLGRYFLRKAKSPPKKKILDGHKL